MPPERLRHIVQQEAGERPAPHREYLEQRLESEQAGSPVIRALGFYALRRMTRSEEEFRAERHKRIGPDVVDLDFYSASFASQAVEQQLRVEMPTGEKRTDPHVRAFASAYETVAPQIYERYYTVGLHEWSAGLGAMDDQGGNSLKHAVDISAARSFWEDITDINLRKSLKGEVTP